MCWYNLVNTRNSESKDFLSNLMLHIFKIHLDIDNLCRKQSDSNLVEIFYRQNCFYLKKRVIYVKLAHEFLLFNPGQINENYYDIFEFKEGRIFFVIHSLVKQNFIFK